MVVFQIIGNKKCKTVQNLNLPVKIRNMAWIFVVFNINNEMIIKVSQRKNAPLFFR
ncbi:MAG: hypothetical protein K0S12_595 [Bacteroidetes bacterium]|jgi:hypothetical protein|nr:hypothetical protein [Bacteroidota bacterium]